MPVYDFLCQKCKKIHEVYRPMADCLDGPKCCGKKAARYYSGNYRLTMDIEPYMTVAADKQTKERVWIKSRREHKEFLHRNGYVEIGNEKAPFMNGKREI